MMSNSSSVQGSKPPAAFIKRVQENSALPVDHAIYPVASSASDIARGKNDAPLESVMALRKFNKNV